jgi:lysophospholipase L1-like esterase
VEALIGLMLAASSTAAAAHHAWQGAGECRLLILGDSLAAEWHAPPPPGWQQSVVGWPGARATLIAERAPDAIAIAQPHALLIMAGSNDARTAALWPWGDAEARAATALASVAQAAQRAGALVVVARLAVLGPQPWWREWLIGERQARAMASIEARLQLPAGTKRLDVPRLLARRDGGVDPALRRDHLHYTAAGYARLAAGLAPLLQAACPA